jgi:hypothetical protein
MVDKLLCRRDDYGHETTTARGLTVAIYQHEDAVLNAAGQLLFILHVRQLFESLLSTLGAGKSGSVLQLWSRGAEFLLVGQAVRRH